MLARTTAAQTLPGVADRFFTTSDGARLHYLEAGPPTAHTIVFIPGWTMPAWIWTPQIAAFSHSYRVIAFDPRGQGDSAIAPSGYEPRRRGQDIAELIARLGPSPVLLVGWSLGVLDALAYVHTHGDRNVTGLVLVDNSVGEEPAPPPIRPPPGRRRPGRPIPHPAYMQSFVRTMFRTPQSPAWLDRLTEATLRTPDWAARALLSYPEPRSYWRDAVYSTANPSSTSSVPDLPPRPPTWPATVRTPKPPCSACRPRPVHRRDGALRCPDGDIHPPAHLAVTLRRTRPVAGLTLAPLFLVSLAALGNEIALTRYFAVAEWSDYGYWVISIVMAGFALSGVALALGRDAAARHGEALIAALRPVDCWSAPPWAFHFTRRKPVQPTAIAEHHHLDAATLEHRRLLCRAAAVLLPGRPVRQPELRAERRPHRDRVCLGPDRRRRRRRAGDGVDVPAASVPAGPGAARPAGR